jgi:hypothetical protein
MWERNRNPQRFVNDLRSLCAPVVIWLLLFAVQVVVPRAQELDARAARSSPMYPPQDVTVEFRGKTAIVSWRPILDDRLANYEVYRCNGNTSKEEHCEKVGTTEKAEFLDKNAASKKVRYKVVAVDKYGNKSMLSQGKISKVVDSKERKSPQ